MTNIKASNIHLNIRGKEILKDVSIDVKEEQFVGIIGPNGSGKSTLLKTIYRSLNPDKGSVRIKGDDIQKLSYKESAQQIATVEQNNEINFDMTVESIVLMGRTPYKSIFQSEKPEDYQYCQEALRRVGLVNYDQRLFSSLSGGERQRVYIARALCQDTDILLLDEPTNHLDIKYQLKILRSLKALNKSILVTLHDLNLAAMFCDYIYLMDEGCIRFEGKPEDVLTKDNIANVYGVDVDILTTEYGLRLIYR
ncbi:ABC transporter [Suicoccus acidiformans]|uniref:ABC transporter n=1 Tax=Suicoccus acidiformans TaxID=2036206 RepID=A0A347WLZ9_9LACT|nr:ABC transporter ATP-binding protein [Suicoccus acidiformans]AXY26106.1 ABC transporter [Suicoccus acidiformans]